MLASILATRNVVVPPVITCYKISTENVVAMVGGDVTVSYGWGTAPWGEFPWGGTSATLGPASPIAVFNRIGFYNITAQPMIAATITKSDVIDVYDVTTQPALSADVDVIN